MDVYMTLLEFFTSIDFGDRVAQNDLRQDASFARVFGSPADRDWLTDICAPLHIQVLED